MSLQDVLNGTYRGKTEFWHKGNGVFFARNDYETAEFTPPTNAEFLETKKLAEKALDETRLKSGEIICQLYRL